MKRLLFFSLTTAATLFGGERVPVRGTPPPSASGVRYTSRNLVLGVADTTIISGDETDHFVRAFTAEGRLLPAFSTIITEPPKARGTGVIVARAGYVLTAAHVIEGGGRIEVVTSKGKLAATPVAADRDTDLALLKLPENTYPALPLADYWIVRVGRPVAAIGFPYPELKRIQPRLVRGVITAGKDEWGNAGHWKLDIASAPGESGAPVIDEQGAVVGIVQRAVVAFPLQPAEERPAVTTLAVKSGYAWTLLEYADPAQPLVLPQSGDRSFEEVVTEAEQAVVLVLVYDREGRPATP